MFELRAKSKDEADILMYGSMGEWDKVRAEDFIYRLTDAKKNGYSKVNLKINSPGGSIPEGVAIMTQMSTEDLFIQGTIEGIAASMSAVMLQGCHKRRMVRAGRMMVHQGQGGVFGTANYIRSYGDLLESYNKTIAEIFAKRSKRDAKYILENWMPEGKDTWFTAQQALAEGLIDEIIEGAAKPLQKEQATTAEMAAHYQQYLEDTTKTGMTREEQIAFLSLKAEATDTEIKAAFDALKKTPTPAPAAATTTTVASEKQKLIDEVVLLAKERGADDKLQESIKKIAAIDMTIAMEMIPKQGAAATTTEASKTPVSVNEALAALKVNGGAAATDSSKWDWDEWSKHPNEFNALLQKNPKEYIRMFAAKFAYTPTEAELNGVVFNK